MTPKMLESVLKSTRNNNVRLDLGEQLIVTNIFAIQISVE